MNLLYRVIPFLALLLVVSTGAARAADLRQQGQVLTTAFYQGQTDMIWKRMTPQMQQALQSKENLAALRGKVLTDWGAETAVVEEKTDTVNGYGVYLRRVRLEKVPQVIQVQWALDSEGRVGGFYIRPEQAEPTAAASPHLEYQTRTRLQLPFAETFYVFWGGRSVEQNYHAVDANQRFALDMVIVREDRSHSGDGKRNEDYFCFGTPLLAPADGTVVEVVEGIADNVPGQMNARQATGNRVIIDHGNNEYSLLAHLRNGSVQVARGDVVRAGARLGECGNSGNSSEPHLHYQLQAGPAFGTSAGLPAQFTDYIADDQPVARGEPTRGQHVRPAGSPLQR
ncbi:M23 family metallopeptidase [Stenotrophomonas sp. 24(2023)]|uniref:M23 family metallopeptidase n=1 Tax=Stenotrophomonas sp. 24(2023) TaxID=3068324 RepID=UPI0027E02BF8|nr:M23 family metallopeptidase [Stenotrophomonas sp. 24(2023)]WMJ67923.1 M23 family metallopeptidase [Stenotrophomonas sp. 24(2023)]